MRPSRLPLVLGGWLFFGLLGLLTGLQKPESGLLLVNGLDRSTLGDSWHELATEAPQFHENQMC
jgi:ATP-binding cassette subfamily B protein